MVRPFFIYLCIFIFTPLLLVSATMAQTESKADDKKAKQETVKPADEKSDKKSKSEETTDKSDSKSPKKETVSTQDKEEEAGKNAKKSDKPEPQQDDEKAKDKNVEKSADSEAADAQPEDDDENAEFVIESKYLLPPSTKAWISIPDVKELEKRFNETQYGELTKDEAIKPFVDSLKQQIRDSLEKRNVRLGIKVEDLDKIQSGEICLAGVLQELEGGQPARGSHGLVLLVDVGETEDAAWELFEKVNKDLAANRETTLDKLEINGIQVNKTTIKNPKRARYSQVSFQTVCNGWLLAADNEEIFRDILRRLSNPAEIVKAATFGEQARFLAVMKEANLGDHQAQINWFVDPFGYIDLAQAISDEDAESRPQRDNWARILKEQGFDVIRGVGGNIGLATGRHEVLHKTFIYAPRERLTSNQKRVFDLFDFQLEKNNAVKPATWIPADVAGYFAGNWDFQKVLDNVGSVYDAFLEEGDFERMIDDFKVDADMQLDIPKLVGMLENQVTIISTTERPIGVSSERVCIGLRFSGDEDYVYQSIKRAVGRKNGEEIVLAGHKVVEVDTTKEPEIDLDLEFGEGIDFGEEEEKTEEEARFNLFDKRYFVVKEGYLLVANEKNFLKKLLTTKPKIKLHDTEDYIEIREALSELTDADKVSFRQFGRIDRALETNYEMMRQGKMGQSQTVLAKILNKILAEDEEGADVQKDREQKLDGSKLPENYADTVAPYLGPTGWVMETESSGWRITGVLLKKKEISEVVKKDQAAVTEGSAQR